MSQKFHIESSSTTGLVDIPKYYAQSELVLVDEKNTRSNALARWLTQTPLRWSQHAWIWPLAGALLLALVGFWVRGRVEGATRAELASRLETLLNADIAALRLWFSEKEADALSFASDVRVQAAVIELVAGTATSPSPDPPAPRGPATQSIDAVLKPLVQSQHYLDYVVVGTNRHVIASAYRRQLGRLAPGGFEQFMTRALAGKLAVSRPFARELNGPQHAFGPTMFVAAPIRSTNGAVIAVLGLRMQPEEEFTRIFSVARMGETGEAYAFDRRGVMLTRSRFEPELKKLGLIPDLPEATAILNLRLVDPGVELNSRNHPAVSEWHPPEARERGGQRGLRYARPPEEGARLTRMAAAAIKGLDDCDVQGYRNYRGIKVVGAWAWLPEYGMGVATEVAATEAFQMLYVLRQVFLVLFGLLVLSAVSILAFSILVNRLRSSLRNSALTARRLGQYVLVQEIGRGANGMVYRARHSLLRRPVAIKLLSPELTNETTAARFEQEVQMTSQLTHPNTVAIYDYGRTPEGLFYYAMEYLSGIDLDQLVRNFGPQPESRVIYILRQICGSLAEAHRIGLIHRDIKPANVVLTRRGGVCDVVKVLDFGLVKARHLKPADTAAAKAVVGTPHFMSPEAVLKPDMVDSRSDLYSLGAIAYWLVTGQTLYAAAEVNIVMDQQVNGRLEAPSQRLGRSVAADLERAILWCLTKSPSERPGRAEDLDQALAQCDAAANWSGAQAEAWWKANLANLELLPPAIMPEKTLVIGPR